MVTFGLPLISCWALRLFLFSNNSDGTFRLRAFASRLLHMTLNWEGKASDTDGFMLSQKELLTSGWIAETETCPSGSGGKASYQRDTTLAGGTRNHLPPWRRVRSLLRPSTSRVLR